METGENLVVRLEAIRRAEQAFLAESERLCDWDDPSDVAEYRRSERIVQRNELLGRLVPSRRCPVCENLVLDSASWVVSKDCRKAVCRSCYFRRFPSKTVNTRDTLFIQENRFSVDGVAVGRLRTVAGCSVREFARRAGWSRAYQRNIESGSVKSISAETASVILQVFQEMGIVTRDVC